jgi:hypothetical protein
MERLAGRPFFAVSGLLLACLAAQTSAAPRVDNFVLLDHQGRAQELYYQSTADAVVILAHANRCPAAGSAAEALASLEADYPEVRFWLVNPEDGRSDLASSAASLALKDAAILEDGTQIVSESLDLDRAGEVLVVNTKTWAIAYRGAIDHARGALDELLAGAPVSRPETEVDGCEIAYIARKSDHGAISYSETIGPMLQENCAYCHVEGGIGPWAMTSYDMVRGFAPMIREVVRTKRMPPWHADPHIGQWDDDRSLSPDQIRTLVHWIEAGAPRGNGPDPLESVTPLASEWPLGDPDMVIEIPGFEVPANGVVDYQFPYVKNDLDHGVWITSATVLPGDRRVVHHVLAGSVEGMEPPSREDSVMDNYIIGYAPGAESYIMPEGTGVYLAPGGHFTFQMHYTPIGKVVVDNSKMGLYLSEAPPENFLRHSVVISPDLNIPPNTPDHEEAAYYEFHDDVIIHTLFPHSHYRGKASTFEVRYPDGSLETVLSVPNYDFNWQRGYNPVEPIALPAGSRLIHRTVYDNSAQNPANPDPHQTIHWGLQSWEEMLYGAFSYSWANETTEAPIHDPVRSNYTQFVGFLDSNMDGKVSWREMPDEMKKRLVQGFKAVDTNGDGGIDVEEFLAMQKQREKAQTTQTDQTGD